VNSEQATSHQQPATDILILYAAIGSGHRRAAEALAEALTGQFGYSCRVVDVLAAIWPRLPAVANNLYALTLKFFPVWYDHLWPDNEVQQTLVQALRLSDLVGLMEQLVAEVEPAACVCTHALPACLLSWLWAKKNGRFPPITHVATDFLVNGLWPVEGSNAFVVATEEAAQQVARRGLPQERIHNLGIPIAANFARPHPPQAETRRQLGLEDQPTLLAVTGGWNAGPYAEFAQTMLRLFSHWATHPPHNSPLQIVVITGNNRENLAGLQAFAPYLPFPVKLLPFVENVADWMRASDLLLTKPGGLTVAESLACGLPLLLRGAGPGQEQANANWLLAEGCAVMGETAVVPLAAQIESLLADPAQLDLLRTACLRHARPQAAKEVAELIMVNGQWSIANPKS
jgi:processive 1,2-diacylglycerol beta-glucosyltransferase